MRFIRICVYTLIILCAGIVIHSLNIHLVLKYILFILILTLILAYHLINIAIREFITMWSEAFLVICSQTLPNEESNILMRHLICEMYSPKNYKNKIKRLCQYIENNFSEEHQNLIVEALDKSIDFDSYSKLLKSKNHSKPLSVNQALRMSLHEILKRDIRKTLGASNSEIRIINKRYLQFLFYIPSVLTLYSFFLFPSNNTFSLLSISLVYVCIINHYISKKYDFPYVFANIYWLLHFGVITCVPILLSTDDFLTPTCFFYFLINFIIIVLWGLQLTNKLWTKTSIEKNKGYFVANSKLKDIIGLKFLIRIRIPMLWITFFISIFFTIVMYAVIFTNHLDLGTGMQCLQLSISVYFGGGQEIFDSIEGLYYYAEVIFSFLLNTLYLGNIVRLIFEPKLSKTAK